MVPLHLLNAAAQKQTAKHAILKRLREAGATSAVMAGSVEIEGGDAEVALADLIGAGTVREARAGLYFIDDDKAKQARPGNGFIALLVILILASIMASVIAIAAS